MSVFVAVFVFVFVIVALFVLVTVFALVTVFVSAKVVHTGEHTKQGCASQGVDTNKHETKVQLT